LIDHGYDVELIFDAPLPGEVIWQLFRMNPERLEGQVAVWDRKTGTWDIRFKDQPKDRVLRVLSKLTSRCTRCGRPGRG
jgi:hypothetical protein